MPGDYKLGFQFSFLTICPSERQNRNQRTILYYMYPDSNIFVTLTIVNIFRRFSFNFKFEFRDSYQVNESRKIIAKQLFFLRDFLQLNFMEVWISPCPLGAFAIGYLTFFLLAIGTLFIYYFAMLCNFVYSCRFWMKTGLCVSCE